MYMSAFFCELLCTLSVSMSISRWYCTAIALQETISLEISKGCKKILYLVLLLLLFLVVLGFELRVSHFLTWLYTTVATAIPMLFLKIAYERIIILSV
jgi:hypothetical protein